MFRRLIFSAVMSGVVVGLVLTVLQSYTVIPMILDAESYESGQPNGVMDPAINQNHEHNHEHQGQGESHAGGHHHGADEWAPDDGFERTFYTAVTNILAAIGFSLLLATCFMFIQNIDWRKGVLWGLGGFIAFQLAPSLGLPPELPGTEAAAVDVRQLWWIATAMATAVGLLLLAIPKSRLHKSIGLLFILVPHLVGAPQPVEHSALAPQSLIMQFIITTTLLGAVFWIMLGALTAYTHNRLSKDTLN